MGKKDDKQSRKKIMNKFKDIDKKKLVGKQLSSQSEVKSVGSLLVVDTQNNVQLQGGLAKLSKDLKVDKKALQKAIKEGYSIKGFSVFAFKDTCSRKRWI